jgi:hypothetical protein
MGQDDPALSHLLGITVAPQTRIFVHCHTAMPYNRDKEERIHAIVPALRSFV